MIDKVTNDIKKLVTNNDEEIMNESQRMVEERIRLVVHVFQMIDKVTNDIKKLVNTQFEDLQISNEISCELNHTSSEADQCCTLAEHRDSNTEMTRSNFDQTDHFPTDDTNRVKDWAKMVLANDFKTKLIECLSRSKEEEICPGFTKGQLMAHLFDNESIDEDKINLSTNVKEVINLLRNHLTNLSDERFVDANRKTSKKLIQDTDLRTNPILNGIETWIELNKGSNCAIGIGLIDKMINGRKLFIIHEIIKKGIAETDKRLQIGDAILQVNDIALKEMTCEEAIEYINHTNGSVKLLIYRQLIYCDQSTMPENKRYQIVLHKVINNRLYEIIQVELVKKTSKGLGIYIANDDQSPGPYINEILPDSVALLDGRLKKGDHIVNVNGEDVTNCSINTTLTMLECLQGSITLTIARFMPDQIVMKDEFIKNQNHQPTVPKIINFEVVILNLKNKPENQNVIDDKTKPKNDRIQEIIANKDSDSINSFELINQTVKNNWDNKSNADECASIGKNWVEVDKSGSENIDRNLNQQLAYYGYPNLEKLTEDNRIIGINGQQLNSSNSEQMIEKLKKTTGSVRLIIANLFPNQSNY